MKKQSRKIEIFLKDGFFVGSITASDVDTILNAIEGHSTPSSLTLEKEAKMIEGNYYEITSNLIVRLDETRTQFLHKEQIILYIKGINLF